jgi:hypothetical protein
VNPGVAGSSTKSPADSRTGCCFRVRVKLVEPGYAPTTRFTDNGSQRMRGLVTEPYAPFAQSVFEALARPAAVTTSPRPCGVPRTTEAV